MLNEHDAVTVLERVRKKMAESGFRIFDEYAFKLATAFGEAGHRLDGRTVLTEYLSTAEALLRSVGPSKINDAKSKLSEYLLDGQPISIELDTTQFESILRRPDSPFEELSAIDEADFLASGLAEIRRVVLEFEYPATDSFDDEDTPQP